MAFNIFACINPAVVVVTTPNQDFNFYFSDPKKFRHLDHKFEWTREEFEDWAGKICCEFGYEVRFTGVGLPAGCQDRGFCTQIAVFTRIDKKTRPLLNFGEFSTQLNVKVDTNFNTDFESRFFNDFLYSFNLVRNWDGLERDEGISLGRIFKIPCINMLCDGSEHRFLKLFGKILERFGQGFRVCADLIFLDFDQEDEEIDEQSIGESTSMDSAPL